MFKKNQLRRRLPIKQLKDASMTASAMLIEKNVAHKFNMLEGILSMSNAPILPGVPTYYLPHRWTIEVAVNQMYNLLQDWAKVQPDELLQDNASEFFKFVVGQMKTKEKKYKQEVKNTDRIIKNIEDAPIIADIFSPLRRYQTAKSLHKFYIDSFAVSVIVKSNGSTAEYADWFLNEWMPSLYKLWSKSNENTDTLQS